MARSIIVLLLVMAFLNGANCQSPGTLTTLAGVEPNLEDVSETSTQNTTDQKATIPESHN